MIKKAIEEYVSCLKQLEAFHNNPPEGTPEGSVYKGFVGPTHLHDFVLKYGQIWQGQCLPKRYRLRPVKACFYNTLMLVRRSKTRRYCEGFVATDDLGMLFHHAWAVNRKNDCGNPYLRTLFA